MQNISPILIIEEDRLNAMTAKRAIEECGAANPIINKPDCGQALEYLRNQDNERPCVVLVDVDEPETGGIEFLQTVNGEGLLTDVPVVAISHAHPQHNIDEILELGAVKHIAMPDDYAELVEALAEVEHLWSPAELHSAAHGGGSKEPPMPY